MEKKVKKVRKEERATEDTNVEVVSDQLKKQITKKEKKQKQVVRRGVVYLKNLPHGFFEPQLKKYFKQFGHVTRVRLGRSLKTGNSRGCAFVEFEIPEVAEIAATTMNNYLMFKKIVKAKYIPPEEQKHNFFKSSVKLIRNKVGKEKYVSAYTARVGRQLQRQNNWTEEVYHKRIQTSLQKLDKLKEKYANLGIDFDSVTVKPDAETMSKIKAWEQKVPAKDEVGSKKSKKSKKTKKKDLSITGVEALLGDTLNEEDSSDEEFIPNENDVPNKPGKTKTADKLRKSDEKKLKTKKKDVPLRALLEETLNDDDSSDEEFVPEEDVLETIPPTLHKATRSKSSNQVEQVDDLDLDLEESDETENEDLNESNDVTDGTQESEELEFEDEKSESDEDMTDFIKVVQKIQARKEKSNKKNDKKLVPLKKLAEKLVTLKKGDEDSESDTQKSKSKKNKVLPGRINKRNKRPVKNAQNSLKEKLKVAAAKELLKNQSPKKAANRNFKKKNH